MTLKTDGSYQNLRVGKTISIEVSNIKFNVELNQVELGSTFYLSDKCQLSSN